MEKNGSRLLDKRKGFTLIELLAVIVILAIIALIATPMIMGVIEKARKGAAIESVNGLIDAAEKYRLDQMLDGSSYSKEIDLTDNTLSIKGSKPDKGTLFIGDNGKIYVVAKYGKYCIEKTYEESSPKVVDDSICEKEIVIRETYKEELLKGADPILKDELIPVTIDDNGIVKKADLTKEWYSYSNKKWANAVILKDESTTYEEEEIIPEENIESYFVWIPKYKYQLWDLGEYDSLTEIDETKAHSIPIIFGIENTVDEKEGECTTPGIAGETGSCQVGDYMTHPAFLTFNTTGFWVGKFETGYEGATITTEAEVNSTDASKIIIKPNVYSWRDINVGNAFKTSYDYKRELESHMMKNTEWGAVAYLSHSNYGINGEITSNNNSSYITGCGGLTVSAEATSNCDHQYGTVKSYPQTTTGNITGIYDMSGGAWEHVMGYTATSTIGVGGLGEITSMISDFYTNDSWKKYYDAYTSTAVTNYNSRILGDATGELGPFYSSIDTDSNRRNKSSWNRDYAQFAPSNYPWFKRGGRSRFEETVSAFAVGIFAFDGDKGNTFNTVSYRLVLIP